MSIIFVNGILSTNVAELNFSHFSSLHFSEKKKNIKKRVYAYLYEHTCVHILIYKDVQKENKAHIVGSENWQNFPKMTNTSGRRIFWSREKCSCCHSWSRPLLSGTRCQGECPHLSVNRENTKENEKRILNKSKYQESKMRMLSRPTCQDSKERISNKF